MIIIGEKLNGSIPSVAKAIAERDADLIRERARMQAEAGATFLDVCASVEEAVEVETLKWMIDLVSHSSKYTEYRHNKRYVPKVGSGSRGALQHSRMSSLNWRTTQTSFCTCGHETQPPKKRGSVREEY